MPVGLSVLPGCGCYLRERERERGREGGREGEKVNDVLVLLKPLDIMGLLMLKHQCVAKLLYCKV